MAVGIFRPFLDALRLIGASIEAGEYRSFIVGVNDIGIARIGHNVAALASTDGITVAAVNESAVAPRADADGRIVLLRTVNSILKIVVGGNVIKLREIGRAH